MPYDECRGKPTHFKEYTRQQQPGYTWMETYILVFVRIYDYALCVLVGLDVLDQFSWVLGTQSVNSLFQSF